MQNNSNKKRIIFVGMPDMATLCLLKLHKQGFNIVGVIPPPSDNPSAVSFINFAKSLNLNVIEYKNKKDVNSSDIIEKIKALKADIGVICSFDALLSKEFLSSTKCGYINAHPSHLPHYRGANPYFHIINNGEMQNAITLHFADEKFDTGNIIFQKGYTLLKHETIGTIFNRSNYMAADMLIEVLSYFETTGEIKSKEQPVGDFIKASKVNTEQRINFNTGAVQIERLIRACNPYYSSYAIHKGIVVKFYDIDYKLENHNLEAGVITKITKDYIEISVKDGYIYPRVLQNGSYGVFDIKRFIEIFKPQIGERFE